MDLESLMADDVARVLLNPDDHAKLFTFYPDGQATGDEIAVVMGPSNQGIITTDRSLDDERRADGFCSLAAIRAVISQILGAPNVRDPRRGDHIERASGAYAGSWYVETWEPTDGDGCVLHLLKSQIHEDAGPDSVAGGT